MARYRSLIALALLVGCGKSEPKADPSPKTDDKMSTSPECAEKIKAFGPWLEKLEIEQESHEIDFGYSLQVIDREPLPLPRKIDVIVVQEKKLGGWDLAGAKHEQLEMPDAPTNEVLAETLAAMFATKPDPQDKELPPPELLRLDIDPKARWGDVVRVVDAATKAGYASVLIAFTATSKVEAPLGTKPKYTNADDLSAARRRMEEMLEKCKPWFSAKVRHEWNPDRAANARANAKETAEGISACNCAADPDEVRVLKWIDSHWHQATIRVPVFIALGGEAAKPIAIAKATPWSEAHPQLLAAAPAGAPPPALRLVAD